jgi:hypothetical protein
MVPGTDSVGDLLAILTGADGAWHRFRGGIRIEKRLHRLATGGYGRRAIDAWHRFRGADGSDGSDLGAGFVVKSS